MYEFLGIVTLEVLIYVWREYEENEFEDDSESNGEWAPLLTARFQLDVRTATVRLMNLLLANLVAKVKKVQDGLDMVFCEDKEVTPLEGYREDKGYVLITPKEYCRKVTIELHAEGGPQWTIGYNYGPVPPSLEKGWMVQVVHQTTNPAFDKELRPRNFKGEPKGVWKIAQRCLKPVWDYFLWVRMLRYYIRFCASSEMAEIISNYVIKTSEIELEKVIELEKKAMECAKKREFSQVD